MGAETNNRRRPNLTVAGRVYTLTIRKATLETPPLSLFSHIHAKFAPLAETRRSWSRDGRSICACSCTIGTQTGRQAPCPSPLAHSPTFRRDARRPVCSPWRKPYRAGFSSMPGCAYSYPSTSRWGTKWGTACPCKSKPPILGSKIGPKSQV